MRAKIIVLASLITVLWSIGLLNLFMHDQLMQWGILPRTIIGMRGILLAPFLHQDFSHLVLNTVPLIVFGALLLTRGIGVFLLISLGIVLLEGSAVWLVGRPAYHIGASGLIFGYFGFLVAAGWYERKVSSILLSVGILVIYGGLLWGVLPGQASISWEGHLFGFLAGVFITRFLKPNSQNETT